MLSSDTPGDLEDVEESHITLAISSKDKQIQLKLSQQVYYSPIQLNALRIVDDTQSKNYGGYCTSMLKNFF